MKLFGPELLRRLTKLWMPIGKKVVIIGGDVHGLGLAEFLVLRKRKVTIVEAGDELGAAFLPDFANFLVNHLTKEGVTILTGVKYEEVTAKGLLITTKDGEKRVIEADTIVPALPPKPNTELLKAWKGKAPEVHLIGDCKEPNLLIDAIADGWRIGYTA